MQTRALAAVVVAALGLAAIEISPARAQSWPSRPVKVIVPFPAGGPTDAMARPVADQLTKVFGQPFLLDNRGGGGTTIGAQAVAKAEPDGYTILIGTNTPYALAPVFNPNAGYTSDQFQPIIMIAESPLVLAVSLKSGVTSVPGLIDAARKSAEGFSYASVGQTSTTHLLAEWFNQIAKLKMAHVPYRGSAPAMNDLVGGQVQVFFDVSASAVPQFDAKTIRVLMVLHSRRWTQLPEVPTAAEAGYPDFVATFWGAIAGPQGTPKEVVDKINKEVNLFLKDPEFIKRLDTLMFSPVGGSPDVMATRIKSESGLWRKIGVDAGLVK